ncbi:Hypothetical predicted protein [Cloeon dipterum]|uniref:Exportin-4 n=1 Tax=Cloeon dipterum TaxID=197152 RepID=A0A8S1C0T2_9INSE|nr:Hypothetical predicted protein [Cloeon dipterum]
MLRELEVASEILLAPPNIVTKEQRQSAEQIFLNFRKTKAPYVLCRHILDTSRVDYVLFEAAGLIKETLIRDWSMLQESDVLSLRQYLLQYVLNHLSLAPFVRERILQVIAVMVKRGSVDDFGLERSSIVAEIESLILHGDTVKKSLGCSIITALMQEYATTVKSSDAGLTWETHFKVKKQFEASDLKRIFKFCITAFSELIKAESVLNDPQTVNLLRSLLSITSSVLCWGFISASHILFIILLIGIFETVYESDQTPALRLISSWKDIIVDEKLISCFFQVHWKVRENTDLSHYSLMCLAQLASLTGPVVSDMQVKSRFISCYISNLITFLKSIKVLNTEALGFAQVFRKLLTFYSPTLLVTLPNELFPQLVQELQRLTCHFAEGAAYEETICSEDCRFIEAFEHLLEAWVSVLQCSPIYPPGFIKEPAVQIFNTYLKCHLAPPDGSRGQGGADHNEEEIYETEEPDRVRFKEQLIIIGIFGRQVLEHSLPLVAKLIEERTERLQSQLQRVFAQTYSISDSTQTVNLFEDLHWLLLVTGHLVAQESEGEQALIPSDLMTYTVQQSQHIDVQANIKLLTTKGMTPSQLQVPLTSLDGMIRILSAILRLCEVESQALEAKLVSVMSPELGSTIVWFLSHWAKSYLLPIDTLYTEVSPALDAAFISNESTVPNWVMNQLLEKVEANLRLCPNETALAKDSANLLLTLVDKPKKAAKILNCSGILTVARFLHNAPRCQPARRELTRGVTLAAAGEPNQTKRLEYLQQVLSPFVDRATEIMSSTNFKKECHEESVRLELIDLLECFTGSIQASSSSSAGCILQILNPVIGRLPELLSCYSNYSLLVELILEFLTESAKRTLWCLEEDSQNVQFLYKVFLNVMQAYARENIGRKSASSIISEEDSCRDLLLILELLTSIASKNFLEKISLDESVETVKAVDICIFGTEVIAPLLTTELLQFPQFCLKFYAMVTFTAEAYPERMSTVPDSLLVPIMTAINLGLTAYGPEVCSQCCDFIGSMSLHLSSHPELVNTSFGNYMHDFLKRMFHLIITCQMNSDCLMNASKSLFHLICCFQQSYHQLVNEILSVQTEDVARERLTNAFGELTTELNLTPDRANLLKFRDNFEKFVANVHGFLLVK